VEDRELVHQVIKRRQRVVETITDDRTPPTRGLPDCHRPVRVLSTLTSYFTAVSVGIALESGKISLERAEAVTSPLALETDAVKRMRHRNSLTSLGRNVARSSRALELRGRISP
jgi:hypothetical protein